MYKYIHTLVLQYLCNDITVKFDASDHNRLYGNNTDLYATWPFEHKHARRFICQASILWNSFPINTNEPISM